jgi:hypothetical protein
MRAGSLRFFTPTELFFQALEPHKAVRLVEAGAGTGATSKELVERGFDMLPLDIMPREGQWDAVLPLDAESVPYSPELWLLICRPDHSGWAYDTMKLALNAGASVFYAGLERNFEIDLRDYLGQEKWRYADAGEEGESLFFFAP